MGSWVWGLGFEGLRVAVCGLCLLCLACGGFGV